MRVMYDLKIRKRREAEFDVPAVKTLRFSLGVMKMDRIRNKYSKGTAHAECSGDKDRDGLDRGR